MLFRIFLASDAQLFQQLAVGCVGADGTPPPADCSRAIVFRGRGEMAASLGVNLHTVLHTCQDLREEGLVEMRRVRAAVVTTAAEPLASLHSEILALARSARVLGSWACHLMRLHPW